MFGFNESFGGEKGLPKFKADLDKFITDTVATKFLSNNNSLFVLELYNDGRINMLPPSSSTPNNNGQVTFEFTNNTTLTIKGKGTDGTVRSVALTLA